MRNLDVEREHCSRCNRDVELKVDDSRVTMLLEEYKICFSEYSYRDTLGVRLFTVILGIITFLITTFIIVDREIPHIASLLVMSLGLGLLFVLHLDLMKVLSCKKAMHQRIKEIEFQFAKIYDQDRVLRIFESINNRVRFKLEQVHHNDITVGGSMLWITRFFAVAWVLYFFDSISWLVEGFSSLWSMT